MEAWYDDPLLMIPGPSELHPRVREVLAGRFYPHYGHEWKELYEKVEDVAKKIFQTKNEIIVMPGPGCLGLELGVLSVADRGGEGGRSGEWILRGAIRRDR
jgi:alanine-glyoxylate transaminase/serine-glyoxylate transaminase/serine-pyruvate transaminase